MIIIEQNLSLNDGWCEDSPTEPGHYWFHGELSWGSCGGHLNGNWKPEFKTNLVEVFEISNGLMAVAEGRFVSLNKFDSLQQREGYLGVWKKAELPAPPEYTVTIEYTK